MEQEILATNMSMAYPKRSRWAEEARSSVSCSMVPRLGLQDMAFNLKRRRRTGSRSCVFAVHCMVQRSPGAANVTTLA